MRLIDADELLTHETESDHINGVLMVVSKYNILSAPTVDLVSYGRWKSAGLRDYACSRCNEIVSKQSKYCCNCGARMEKI